MLLASLEKTEPQPSLMMISPSPLEAESLPSWVETKLPVPSKMSLRASVLVESLHPSWLLAEP